MLNRDFHAAGPGEKRVSGITYLRTAGGRPYLTAAFDLYDRKITGRAFGGTTGAEETAAGALETRPSGTGNPVLACCFILAGCFFGGGVGDGIAQTCSGKL
ncbi:MAG: hypothetical protein LBG27_06765 [Spirochaetaceae bacterium]|nr:hypothetical protein [Spirochaetaceae bacterium]